MLLLDVDAFGTVFPEPLNRLEDHGIGFLQRVSARETLLGLQTIRQVAGMPFVPLRSHSVASYKLRFKRLFDLVIVVVTAPLWLVALAVLALYVLVRDGRPVIYRQTRVGLRGREFDAASSSARWCATPSCAGAQLSRGTADPRIVKGLAWMRATRADELPQLFNVIRGQMSLVGPRPERPELVAEIEQRVPGYTLRNELPPGLTGLAQIHGRYSTDAAYKLGLRPPVHGQLVTRARPPDHGPDRVGRRSPAVSESDRSTSHWPAVAVVMPVRDEARHLDAGRRGDHRPGLPG